MESLQDILGGKDFSAPDEVTKIKDFIKRRYKSSCQVSVGKDSLIIGVTNSALAATLRMEQRSLIEQSGVKNKKVIIRIG